MGLLSFAGIDPEPILWSNYEWIFTSNQMIFYKDKNEPYEMYFKNYLLKLLVNSKWIATHKIYSYFQICSNMFCGQHFTSIARLPREKIITWPGQKFKQCPASKSTYPEKNYSIKHFTVKNPCFLRIKFFHDQLHLQIKSTCKFHGIKLQVIFPP